MRKYCKDMFLELKVSRPKTKKEKLVFYIKLTKRHKISYLRMGAYELGNSFISFFSGEKYGDLVLLTISPFMCFIKSSRKLRFLSPVNFKF